MKARPLPLFLLLTVFSFIAIAQSPDPSQNSGQRQRGRGAWGSIMGNGVMGTVTQIAPDHFAIKTESGEPYTVFYSVNTRIMKGGAGGRGSQRQDFAAGAERRTQSESDMPMTPPQPIKASEIKIGDAIMASGEADANAKTVGAVVIFQLDPERVKQMRQMQANYGKTWLMGRVTAINDVKVTLQGGPDNATHAFVADENTTFRKRRDPITLADIQVGDMVRVEGALKNGAFVAATVGVMGQPPQRAGQQSGTPALPPQ